jgi:hypothetical protein
MKNNGKRRKANKVVHVNTCFCMETHKQDRQIDRQTDRSQKP